MDIACYAVQIDPDESAVVCETPQDVFALLKKQKLITILRYNDTKTGVAYAKAAASSGLAVKHQEKSPVYIKSVLSDEGAFVPSEAFWIENYMFDEFYNPDCMPYIEAQTFHEEGSLF